MSDKGCWGKGARRSPAETPITDLGHKVTASEERGVSAEQQLLPKQSRIVVCFPVFRTPTTFHPPFLPPNFDSFQLEFLNPASVLSFFPSLLFSLPSPSHFMRRHGTCSAPPAATWLARA